MKSPSKNTESTRAIFIMLVASLILLTGRFIYENILHMQFAGKEMLQRAWIVELIAVTISILLAYKLLGPQVKEWFKIPKAKNIIRVSIFISGTLIYTYFIFKLSVSTGIIDYILFLKLIILALCAAILEEFIYRGILLQTFRKHTNIFGAILMSSFIFSIMQATPLLIGKSFELPQLSIAFILGLLYGFLTIHSDTLLVVIFGHAIYNFALFSNLLFTNSNIEHWTPLYFSFALINVLVLIIYHATKTIIMSYKQTKNRKM